jgi:uncharacterized membrane protein YhaH (DUF805 family)
LALKPSDFWTWRGKIGRAAYAGVGILLFAIKHNLDRAIASAYGHKWGIFNYWIYDQPAGIDTLSGEQSKYYATLVVVAIPFIWIGVVLTLRRLRDANLPLWMVAFFFLPFLNLVFFLILAVIPSASMSMPTRSGSRGFYRSVSKVVPDGELGSAVMGIVATAVLAVVATMLSARGMGNYGWGLFVGIPFFLGLNSVLIYGFHRPRSLGKCLVVSLLSVALVGAALFAVAIEGLICLLMALPLAIVVALFGGFIGFILQQRQSFPAESLRVFSLIFVLLPGLVFLESAIADEPPLYEVRTSLVVNAAPDKVWPSLIAFGELKPPEELLFQTGIAYPIRAEIDGAGVGAIRHCVFSTGEFVEPIKVWDEPRLLKFVVTAQPRVMDEWSPYRDLHPPHLENYLLSREGQFLLTPIPGGKTLLEGTTWYQNRFWPAAYWNVWSDYIIHRIHMRVLAHIKGLAENNDTKQKVE